MSVKKEVGTSQTVVLVAVYDKKLLDVLHLKRLASLQKELSEIAAVKKITSLYTMPNLRSFLDEHVWHSVLENRPYTQENLVELKSDVMDNELFVGKFVGKTADTMLFYLTIPDDALGKKGFDLRDTIQGVLNQYQVDFSKVFQLGSTEMSYVLIQKARHDFLVCIPVVFALMAILFGCLFRNIYLFILPCFSSIFGVICALGVMGWLGIPVSPLFIAAIVLTLAIGVAESAHIIYAYQKSILLYPLASPGDRQAFILKAVLLPFLLAVFTALLGFMLDVLSFVPVIVDAAYALALCIAFNTSASILISPLLLQRMKVKITGERKFFHDLSRALIKLNVLLSSYARWVVTILLCLSIVGIAAFYIIPIETLPYALIKKNDPLIRNLYFIDNKVSGLNLIKVSIYSKDKNVFLKPEYLQKILDTEESLMKIPGTSHTYGVSDVVATTYQIFLFNTRKFFKIPEDQEILGQYYQILEKEGFIRDLINKDFNDATLYINYKLYSSSELEDYRSNIEKVLTKAFNATSLKFKIMDSNLEFSRIVSNLLSLQLISIFSIYLICFFTIGVMFRSVKAGLISVIPNIFPLCIISVVQYIFAIPITTFSVILYSIVVGLSMDETIHIFYAFREKYTILQDKHAAIEAALTSQVVPVTIASVSIATSWLVLLFSQFLPVFQLGFLCGIGIFSAWVADLVVTPFLLRRVNITK